MNVGFPQLLAILIVVALVVWGGIAVYQGGDREAKVPIGDEVTEEFGETVKVFETSPAEELIPPTEVVPINSTPAGGSDGSILPVDGIEIPSPPVEPELPVIEEEQAPSMPEATTTPSEKITEPEATVPTPTKETAYVINEFGGTISAIDVTTETVVNTAQIAEGGGALSGLHTIISSPDNTRLYVSDHRADKVIVVKINDLSVIKEIDVDEAPNGLSVTPDGSKLYVANFDSNTVSVVDTVTFAVTTTISVDRFPSDVTVSPDGTKAYVTHFYNNVDDITRVLIINTGTDTVSGEVSLPSSSRSRKTVFTQDGSRAFISIERSNGVGVIDAVNNTVIKTIGAMLNVRHIIMSRDEKFVYVVAESDIVGGTTLEPKVYAINVAAEKLSRQMSGFRNPRGIAETVSGTKLYVAEYNSDEVRIFDLDADKVVTTISVGDAPLDIIIIPGS